MPSTMIAEAPDGDDLTVTVNQENITAFRSYARLSRDLGHADEADAMERHADNLTARLTAVTVADPAPPIAPQPQPIPKPAPPKRRALRVAVALAAAAVVVGIAPHAPHASAAEVREQSAPVSATRAYPTANPIRIVVSGPRVTVSARLISTAPRPDGTHAAMLLGPNGFFVSGESRARSQVAVVTVTGTLPSHLLAPGPQMWIAGDAGDESYVGVGVKVMRQSRFGRITTVPVGAGRMFLSAPLSHYNIPTGTYTASKSSPVQVQYAAGRGDWRRWVTAATMSTTAAGQPAAKIVGLPKGQILVRLVRPEGGNVTGVASGTITVTVR